jgi:hypothetical protein
MERSIILQSWPGTIRLAIAVSADPMPRRSAAVEGDLFTTLPAEAGSPLAAWNRAGVELAAGV